MDQVIAELTDRVHGKQTIQKVTGQPGEIARLGVGDPLLTSHADRVLTARGGRSERQRMHQRGMVCRKAHGDHAALRRAENIRVTDTQRLHHDSGIIRHILDRVALGQVGSAVKYIDGIFFGKALVPVFDRLSGKKNAFDGKPGQDNKCPLACSEGDIRHLDAFCDNGIGFHSITPLFIARCELL